MSIRSGLPVFYQKLPTGGANANTALQVAIPISKGTYLITANISIVSAAAPTGVLVSLNTTNAAPEVVTPLDTVIFRNSGLAVGDTVSLPAGITTIQPVVLSCVYTIPADTTIYLNYGANNQAWTVTATTGSLNSVQFVQLAP